MTSSTPKALQTLNIVSILMFIISLGLVFLYAPREAVMGEAQRIFYYHVPSAWLSFVAFGVTLIAGIGYLRTGDHRWDRLGIASVEVGIVFAIMALLSGMLWARPIWNTWWTWDPRLTTYTILLLIYFAYLMLRQGIEDPDKRARFGSVYGIVGFISVPITYFSIYLWRTIHPAVFGRNESETKMSMEPQMLQTFIFCNIFFMVVFATLLWHRFRLENDTARVEELRMKASHA
jgi:heme exporter protein C